jgi:hypothetical protein
MIIPLARESSTMEDRFLICLVSPLDVTTFVQRAKVVPGSYAGRLISDLYEGIFKYSLELKHDYETYFQVEYPTVHEYLQRRFMFPASIQKRVATRYTEFDSIIYFKSFYTFIEGEYGTKFLRKLLEPRLRK